MDRLTQLKDRLAASLKPDGKPMPGYGLRAAMLEAEIARLETGGTARGAATKDPAESSSAG